MKTRDAKDKHFRMNSDPFNLSMSSSAGDLHVNVDVLGVDA